MKNHVRLLFKPIVIAFPIPITVAIVPTAVIARARSVRSNPATMMAKCLWLWIASSLSFLAMTVGVKAGKVVGVRVIAKRLWLWIASSLAFLAMTGGVRAGVIAMTVAAVVMLSAFPAYAQQSQPADSCSAGEAGRYRLSGGPDLAGAGYLLTCNGAQWVKVFGFEMDGIFSPQFSNMPSCTDGNLLAYDAASGGLRCMATCDDQTPDGFSFTDIANADPSTVISSNIVRIQGINCQVMVSVAGHGAPQYRICGNASCSNVVQDWTNQTHPLTVDQYVQLRLTSSVIGGDIYTANLFVGGGVGNWRVASAGDCADPAPAPGTICADGTVYAGLSPDGNVKMYTTRCDEGRSWSGTACTGSRLALYWNNGNRGTSYVDTGIRNAVTGAANTAALIAIDADSETSGFQNHQAAKRCADSTAEGYTDWYLPAFEELRTMMAKRMEIGDFHGTYYWSSEEAVAGTARALRSSDSYHATLNKADTNTVRCVRKD